jgi:hypothetical protein
MKVALAPLVLDDHCAMNFPAMTAVDLFIILVDMALNPRILPVSSH